MKAWESTKTNFHSKANLEVTVICGIFWDSEKANTLKRCFEQLAKMYIKAKENCSYGKEHNHTILKHWQRLSPHHAFSSSYLVIEPNIIWAAMHPAKTKQNNMPSIPCS